tara:strand:+ start:966 stop:1265 length:300 start_codon:yes stop_codon:yes gene_type:complete
MEFYLTHSKNPKKKYSVLYINKDDKLKTINFGSSGYDDYIITNNDKQKNRYKQRHKHDNINDYTFAGFWSMHLLWNHKTIKQSIKNIERTYKIKIINLL